MKSTCFISKASKIIRHSSLVEALNLIIESKSLPTEVNDLTLSYICSLR